MNIWSIFVTGLFSGGASCAAVQGGLLAGAVARRRPEEEPPSAEPIADDVVDERAGGAVAVLARPKEQSAWVEDAVPVGGFLVGKLVSHVAFGLALGAFGAAIQPNFRVRAYMQMAAGALMILMALNLIGVFGKRTVVIQPPAAVRRLVRRSTRADTTFAPALLGFLTILVPCGVTLSIEFLIIANGSPLTGAVALGAFVVGTTPLFAAIGYVVRRAGAVLRGYLTKIAAVAVAIAGVLAINSGLVLTGSGVTLQKVAPGVVAAVPQALGGGAPAPQASPSDASQDQPAPAATVGADGVQVIEIHVGYGDPEADANPFSPSKSTAKAGLPTRLKLVADSPNLGCAGVFVMPHKNLEKGLTFGEDITVDLGVLGTGSLGFACGSGHYDGVVKVVEG